MFRDILHFDAMADISQQSETQRIVIIPGMGCTPVRKWSWYAWLQYQLESDPTRRFAVVLEDMPDPLTARESQLVPFIRDTLKFDKDQVRGVILVAACHTDRGHEIETASEYYNRPWDWDTIRSNADWIVQLHSPSDKIVPEEEGRFVADKLKSEYMKLERRGHFMDRQLPELLKVIREKC